MKARYGLLLAVGLLIAAGDWFLVERLRSTPPPRGVPPAPRLVLLYAPCTVSKRFLSPYNPRVRFTPNLEAFAAQSVVFERHQTEEGQSGVAYAALFSGTEADRHGIYKHPTKMSDRVYLMPEAYADAGYKTFFWSVHPMASPELNFGQGVPPENTYYDDGTLNRFLRAEDPDFRSLLERLSVRSRRAFVMTNFSVTHGLYSSKYLANFCRAFPSECPPIAPAESVRFLSVMSDQYHELSYDFEATRSRLGFDDATTRRFISFVEVLYKSNVWYLDSLFGAVINEIKRRDLLDRSLIVFTADHGEVLFRSNAPYKWTHGFALAPEDIEVPLIIRSPLLEARRYASVTRSIDVFPTMAGLSNIGIRAGEVEGEDLSAALLDDTERELLAFSHTALVPDRFMTDMNPRFRALRLPFPRQDPELMWVQVRQRDLVYKLTNRDGKRFRAEVYDRSTDLNEFRNLYDPADGSQREMFRQLETYKQRLVEAYNGTKASEGKLPSEREEEILRRFGYIK